MAECHFALESCVRYVLGTSTPIADIAQAVRQLQIDVLALSFSAYASRRDLLDGLQQLIDQLTASMDQTKFDLRELPAADAATQLDTAKVYGQLTIPADFSAQLDAFGRSALQPGTAVRPTVTMSTNPRAGTLAASIAGIADHGTRPPKATTRKMPVSTNCETTVLPFFRSQKCRSFVSRRSSANSRTSSSEEVR